MTTRDRGGIGLALERLGSVVQSTANVPGDTRQDGGNNGEAWNQGEADVTK